MGDALSPSATGVAGRADHTGQWGPGPYSRAIQRVIAVLAGVAQACLSVVSWPTLADLLALARPAVVWWSLAPIAVLLLAAALTALIALVAPVHEATATGSAPLASYGSPHPLDPVWRALLTAAAVWYFAALGWALFAASSPDLTIMRMVHQQVPLLGQFYPLAIVIPIVFPRWTRPVAAAAPPLVLLVTAWQSGIHTTDTLLEAPYYLLFNVMYLAWSEWVLNQARALDDAHEESLRREFDVARERAATETQRRRDAFIHDHVLSVLVPAATRAGGGSALAAAVRGALSSLDDASMQYAPGTASELAEAILTTARDLGLDVRLRSAIAVDRQLPPDVGDAVRDAAAEALRNTARHAAATPAATTPMPQGASVDPAPPEDRATRHVAVTVDVTSGPDALVVRVSDDGPGFDLTRALTGRYGVQNSIIQRMRDVGGSATVTSAPQQGTIVDLVWSPLPAPAADVSDSWRRRAGVDSTLALQTPVARLLGTAVLVLQAGIAWVCMPAYADPAVVYAVLVVQAVAAGTAMLGWRASAMPGWVAWSVAVVAAASPLAVLLEMPTHDWPMWAPWAGLTGSVLLFGILVLRRQWRIAWAGFALRVLVTCAWIWASGNPFLPVAADFTVSHAFSLATWTVAALASARASRVIEADERHILELRTARDAQRESRRLMDVSLASVARRARPVLDALADESSCGPISEDMRLSALRLEGELRDEIRAPSFTGTPVTAAARGARARGADVVLLDDRSGRRLGAAETQHIIDSAVDALNHASGGRAVIRVSPPGRPHLAAITVDGSTTFLVAPVVTTGTGSPAP